MRNRLALGIVFLLLFASQSFAGPSRIAIPSADQEAKLRQAVHTQFSEMYAGASRADQLTLCKLLLQESSNAQTPDQQFAFLCEARDAAARAGDFATAQWICGTMVARFDLSMAAARVGTFAAAAGGFNGDPADYFTLLISAIHEAMFADDFIPAKRLLEIGATASANSPDDTWQKIISLRQVDFDAQCKAFNSIRPAIDGYRKNPTDAKSNLIVGEYICFVKGDWQAGLPLLARGSDDSLRQLARNEIEEPRKLAVQPQDDGKQQLTVADGWDAFASSVPQYATQLSLHEYDWYLRALPHVPNPGEGYGNHVERQLLKLIPQVGV
jgi:hypothetical protein